MARREGKVLQKCSMRVLIAGDQRSMGTSLAELLQRCQHEVVEVVGSGLEAIHAYGRHRPDVVLMDYHMSKLNGATACRNIVAKHPDARVILVSGSPTEIAGSGALALLLVWISSTRPFTKLRNPDLGRMTCTKSQNLRTLPAHLPS
ncbi:MAG: response regulator transcription factor [Chthoniobacterales bacterium]